MNKLIIFSFAALIFTSSCAQGPKKQITKMSDKETVKKDNLPVTDTAILPAYKEKTEAEYKAVLPADVFTVARLKGTERPWTSKFENLKDTGTYYCAVCGNGLFKSDAKFESGCGWPSFYEPLTPTSIIYETDNTHGMERTETMCGRCKSHLGHVFKDAPKTPTGLRYCINGVVLDFKKAQEAEKKYEAKKQ